MSSSVIGKVYFKSKGDEKPERTSFLIFTLSLKEGDRTHVLGFVQAAIPGASFSDRFIDIVIIEDAGPRKPDAEDDMLLQLLMPGSPLASSWCMKNILVTSIRMYRENIS